MAQEYIKLSHTDIESLIAIMEDLSDLSPTEESTLLKLKQIRLAQRSKLSASKLRQVEPAETRTKQ